MKHLMTISTNECINKLLYILIQYNTAIERYEVLVYTMMYIYLKSIMPSERSQTQRSHMVPIM